MKRLAQITQDYRDAGAMSDLVNLYGFVDDARVPHQERRPRRGARPRRAWTTNAWIPTSARP